MMRLKDTRYQSGDALLERAVAIAEHYGFVPLQSLKPVRDYRPAELRNSDAQRFAEVAGNPDMTFARREEKALAHSARKLLARAAQESTVLAWHITTQSAPCAHRTLELHIIGSPSVLAEALLVVIADAVAREVGLEGRIVLSINNMGSTDSAGRFMRDVGVFLRKHLDTIAPALRPRAAIDPIGTLVQLIERGHPVVARAPQPAEYLNEEERKRFWEFLEYLETLGIAYELNAHLLGSSNCWSQTLFEVSYPDAETGTRIPFSFGGRYDPLASRIHRRPTHAASVSITCEIGRQRASNKPNLQTQSNSVMPAIYFAHLGTEARRRALPLLEMLRQSSIPVHQSLWFERMGDQMAVARKLATPYIIIMGHKEAIENTVLVREVATNSQSAVPVDELAGYLKRRRIGFVSRPVTR